MLIKIITDISFSKMLKLYYDIKFLEIPIDEKDVNIDVFKLFICYIICI